MDEFQRIKRLPPYVFNITNEMKMAARMRGEDIIDFGMGNPEQPTPEHIVDKLIEAAKRPDTHRYSTSRGIPRLRLAITQWYERKFNVDLNPETEAIVTIGSKEGLAHLALAMTGPGDTVIVPNPCYPVHYFGFVIAGAAIKQVPLIDEQQFLEDIKKNLENTWPKPKAIVISFPANPTTQCVSLEFFEQIVDLAKHHQVWVIHDIAYAEITFDGYQPPSILQVPHAKDIAVETYSLSKTYNMPGWRVGFVCGNPTLIAALARIKSYLDYGMFTPIQVAAIAALEGPQDCVAEICGRYQERRDVLCEGLAQLDWPVEVPKATMFVWAKIPEAYRHLGSLEFTKMLLQEAKVAASPGIGFGEAGDEFLRFGLIENIQRTRQALRGIKHMMNSQESNNETG